MEDARLQEVDRAWGWRRLSGFLVFTGLFAAILSFFSLIDVHNRHFNEAGFGPIYNLCRVIFVAYYFWLLSFIGLRFLGLVAGRGPLRSIGVRDKLALGFFTGTAVVTVVMLAAGSLSLYLRWLAAAVALGVIALSYRDFEVLRGEAARSIGAGLHRQSALARILVVAMALAAAVAGATLLLVKGLYPQGGHDYYLHYYQFYSLVIENHGISPNEFWYHYFYSKGVGVTFWAMLLTDNLGPSLAAFCSAVAAAIALLSLVGRAGERTLWPWGAAIVYLALNVHTLGTGIYGANGGWGHFQKPHELNSPLLIGILWMSVELLASKGSLRRTWWWGAAAGSFSIAFLLIISSAIVGFFFALVFAVFLILRRRDALAFFGLGVATGCGLAAVVSMNFLTTGIPTDIALNLWWPILDLKQLNQYGWLFDVSFIAGLRSEGFLRGLSSHGLAWQEFLLNVTRFDILAPFVIGGAAAIAIGTIGRFMTRWPTRDSAVSVPGNTVDTIVIVLLFTLAVAAFGATFGTTEPISYVRASSYFLPLVIAIVALAWQFAIMSVPWSPVALAVLGWIVPIGLAGLTVQHVYSKHSGTLVAVLDNAIRFVGGRYSIHDAYGDQSGWPALPKSGAIYPPIYEAWKTMTPGSRLWSFHVHTYCMVPGCRVESHLSSILSSQRNEILLGAPQQAKAALQRAGVNDFFISTELDIRDPMICTPLFSPETIGDYMGVKWTNGADMLLTWKGPGSHPIPATWVDNYRAHLKMSKYTPDCSKGLPDFTRIGHSVHQQVIDGRRWGRDIALPK